MTKSWAALSNRIGEIDCPPGWPQCDITMFDELLPAAEALVYRDVDPHLIGKALLLLSPLKQDE